MKKIIELPERFPTGEPTLRVLAHWNGHRHIFEKDASQKKYASEAFDYISAIDPRAGETLILVNALGTYEAFDMNRNGDGFNESPYKVGVKPLCECDRCKNIDWKRGWINDDEVVTKHYKSFESGGIYQHHSNKNPEKSLGRVEKAFWNAYMHRIELLLSIKNALAPDWINEIENGTYSAVSMGCHVRWDVCSNCGHRAPTRKDYCDHLKWEMNKIDPSTGVRNAALNPSPKFFDISKVFRPADPQGFMIKKVAEEGVYEVRSSAELGEKVASFEFKQAQIRKLSDIQKIITGEISYAKLNSVQQMMRRYRANTLPGSVISMESAGENETDEMAKHPLSEVASTLAEKGAGLTTSELVTVLFKKAGYGTPSSDLLDRAVAIQPLVNAIFERFPLIAEKLAAVVMINADHSQPSLSIKLGSWLEKRANASDYLLSSLGRTELPGTQWIRDREPPRTDVLYVTDPHSGDRYTTTRGAAMAAHDEEAKAELARNIGGAVALSGAYRLGLGRMLPAPKGIPLAASLYAGHKALQHLNKPSMTSEEGYVMPMSTEMIKENSFNPYIPATNYLDLIAFDYEERIPTITKTAEIYQKELLLKIGSKYPQSMFITLYPLEEKVSALFGDLETRPEDPTDSPDVNLEKVLYRLGQLVVN